MSIRKTDMIYLRVTPQERKRIEEKMAELGIHNMSAYIRKMALDGLCICLDLKDIRSLTEQVARCGNAVCPPLAEALVRANMPEWCGGRIETMEQLRRMVSA